MKIIAIGTHKITTKDKDLFKILDQYLPQVEEKSVVAITSKITSLCEGRVVKIGKIEKEKLIKQEADYYLPKAKSKYGITLTIKNNLLIASAGIDESNGNGYYVLWPTNPQETANKVRHYLRKRFKLKKVGIVITDSKTTPLRWGVTGVAIAHSGFSALNDYIGTADLFGRELKVTKVNVVDALAVAAVLVMGEGKEQTPLALITEVPFVKFTKANPSEKELKQLRIKIEDDLYAPLLQAVGWKRRKRN